MRGLSLCVQFVMFTINVDVMKTLNNYGERYNFTDHRAMIP